LQTAPLDGISIAVLIPCFNEEAAIAGVVHSFRSVLPTATIYVYDNNSTDGTVSSAAAAGATVRRESYQGKGNVVRRMFADIDAEVYVLVDGDGTYDASAAPTMITHLLEDGLDVVNGARVAVAEGSYRPGHRFGNWLLTGLVRWVFGRQFYDMLSGYKVLSRRFAKSFPAMSSGFEIETELVVHALELRMPCAELKTQYRDRPPGSTSKLRTYYDGARILRMITQLVKDERPFEFFGFIGGVLIVSAVVLAVPVFTTYFETGLVPRLPTAVLSVGLVIVGLLSCFVGMIIGMITRTRQELKRLLYLAVPQKVSTR